MKTMRTNKMSVALMAGVVALMASASTSQASWTSIAYENPDPWGGSNTPRVNAGANTDGYYYTSAKPGTGDWTFNYDMRPVAKDAGWTTLPLSIWSADNAFFQTFDIATNNYAISSDIQIKIVLSEAVTGAAWTPSMTLSSGSSARFEYSANGTDWTTAATYSAPATPKDTYALAFATPTNALYLRLNADAGAVWMVGQDNTVAFTVPEPMSMALLGLGSLVCLRRRNRK